MSVKVRLSIMMFLQYAVWGAWYVTVGNYMTAIGMQSEIYWAFTVSPIASIISPFFLGMIADRYFSTEKILGVLHIIGGIAMFISPMFAEGPMASPTLFIVFLLINMLCYMPTVALTNSLAFNHLSNQEKEFPIIRAFGTFGWIAAGVLVSKVLGADLTSMPLKIAGVLGVLLGIFSFILPHTPPPALGEKASFRKIIGIDAFNKIKSKPFYVFIISSFLICIPLSVYYAYAPVFVNSSGLENPGFIMSFGQMSEFVFILLMPLLFPILGIKKMLLTGMFAWVLRYFLFALGAPDQVVWMILGGVILHGICYDFFFVAGFIYVDKKAVKEIRAQAQGFVVLATYGFGMLIGAQLAGYLFNGMVDVNSSDVFKQWQNFWYVPAVLAAIVMVFFAIMFKDKEVEKLEGVK
ncbi:MAG: MFS transporter [Melioribacteraceae bacterium]|nr:MFS transporter [Melioribacteraceae bacterium]